VFSGPNPAYVTSKNLAHLNSKMEFNHEKSSLDVSIGIYETHSY
jgi:hypothetical protein